MRGLAGPDLNVSVPPSCIYFSYRLDQPRAVYQRERVQTHGEQRLHHLGIPEGGHTRSL
jgi:hypothetical protein